MFLLKGARSMLCRGRGDEAAFLFEEVLRLVPDSPDAIMGLAASLHLEGRVEEVSKLDDSSLAFKEILCASLYELGKTEEAFKCLDEILDIDPARETALALLSLFNVDIPPLNIFDKPAKKNDVILINSPYWIIGAPNCGLGYVSESLRRRSIDFSLVDLNSLLYNSLSNKNIFLSEYNIIWYHSAFFRILLKKLHNFIEKTAQQVIESDAFLVGVSVSYTSRCFSIELARAIKRKNPDLPVVFGGYDCLWVELCRKMSERYSSNVDAYVVGEGDESFPAFVKAYLNTFPLLPDVPGVFLPNRSYTKREPSSVDKFFPTYKELDTDSYRDQRGVKFLCIHASRGCFWGRCVFCSLSLSQRVFRQRSPASIYGEIKYHYLKNGVTHFVFSDMHIGGEPENLLALAQLLINDKKLKVSLAGQIRFSPVMCRPSSFKTLKKAGFSYLQFGLESASPRVLKEINKGITVDLAARCLKLCREAEIITGIFLITGFPFEKEEDHRATLNFLKKVSGILNQVESASPFLINYGSKYWKELENKGVICDDFVYKTMIDDWEEGKNNLETRMRKRREILDLANGLGMSSGLFSSDGSTISKLRFFIERGEIERAEKIFDKMPKSAEGLRLFGVKCIEHGMLEKGLAILEEYKELYGQDISVSYITARGNIKLDNPAKALQILQEQQRHSPCFDVDFHLLAEKVYMRINEKYLNSNLFRDIVCRFSEIVEHHIRLSFSSPCLLLASSFKYHVLTFLHVLKNLGLAQDVFLLVKGKDAYSDILPEKSTVEYFEGTINRDMAKKVSDGLKGVKNVVVLKNQTDTYQDVFQFCLALDFKDVVTVSWNGEIEKVQMGTQS